MCRSVTAVGAKGRDEMRGTADITHAKRRNSLTCSRNTSEDQGSEDGSAKGRRQRWGGAAAVLRRNRERAGENGFRAREEKRGRKVREASRVRSDRQPKTKTN